MTTPSKPSETSEATCVVCLSTGGACVLHAPLFLELWDFPEARGDPAAFTAPPKKKRRARRTRDQRRRMLESAIDQARGVLALLAAELELEREGRAR